MAKFVPGVMQACNSGGVQLNSRYSPSFRDDPSRGKLAASKRKRDNVLRYAFSLLSGSLLKCFQPLNLGVTRLKVSAALISQILVLWDVTLRTVTALHGVTSHKTGSSA